MLRCRKRLFLLLDFETIIAEINPEINAKLTTFDDAPMDMKAERSNVHVLCAEDSPLLRELLVNTLHESGYRFVRDLTMVRMLGIIWLTILKQICLWRIRCG